MKTKRGDRATGAKRAKAAGRLTASNVDAYLAALEPTPRAALQRLREHILAAVPELEECINYGVPSYRIAGKHAVSFGVAAKHCAFYPGAVVDDFAEDLCTYDTSKGTIRFQPDQPLPAALIRRLVKAQVARRSLGK